MRIYLYLIFIVFILISLNFTQAFESRSDDYYITLAKEVAQAHKWKYPSYVCNDFAWDLMIKLNLNGYLANRRNGKYYPCSKLDYQRFRCRHTWIEVWVGKKLIQIEATTGKVISPEYYKDHYK